MSETAEAPTIALEELGATYEIIGELAGDRDDRRLLGRRKSDGVDVLIVIAGVPRGDEGNALNHLAADTQLLSRVLHDHVLAVLEGSWLGDAYAVVSKRPAAPTLEELLVRREEEFSYGRVATILRDVNAALMWARERRVVHRDLTADAIYIEPGSDRPLLSFRIRPLGLTDMPGEAEDAQTIARLARLMFTRKTRSPDDAASPLIELRPGLPTSVAEQADALLDSEGEQSQPDVQAFIAAVAMADALKAGEEHLERARNVIEEQKRQHQAQIEKERREHDAALKREKEAHARERDAHQRDREILRLEREAHERDSEALKREREAHDTEITAVLADRARRRTRQGLLSLALLWQKRPRVRWLAKAQDRIGVAPTAAAAAALVALIAILAVATQRTKDNAIDSAAGEVAPRPTTTRGEPRAKAADTTAIPDVPADMISGVAERSGPLSRFDFGPAIANKFEPARPRFSWSSQRAGSQPVERPRPLRRVDTIFTTPMLPRPDTLLPDSLARPKRDSIRDTTRRDTIPNW